jgi:antitoxin MazE
MVVVTQHAPYIQNIHIGDAYHMAIQVQIAKWGNSLGVRIPRDVAARSGLTEGARVDIEAADDGRIIISRSRRRFALEELLAGMIPEREHRLEDDDAKGEEII